MIRSSQHILKYQTGTKSVYLEQLYSDYKNCLQFYVDLLWGKSLPLKTNLSSKLLPEYSNISHSRWKQVIYKNASEIIRSNNMKKKTSKPNIENISINIDERLTNTITSDKEFDEFIRVTTPYFYENKHLAIPINLPVKQHKHSLKYKDWNRKKTIKLKKINDNFYAFITYEKPNKELKTIGKSIGLDSGYKKLLVTSDNQFIGKDLTKIYNKLSKKKVGSRNFKQALKHRDNQINEIINKDLDLTEIKQIVIENLKNVKHKKQGKIVWEKKELNCKTKVRKNFNNKLQRWTYPKVINKLERLCEENGVLFTKINPAYTSQTCSKCGAVDKTNREGSSYQCKACGLDIDADYNAAINIKHRGIYSSSTNRTEYSS